MIPLLIEGQLAIERLAGTNKLVRQQPKISVSPVARLQGPTIRFRWHRKRTACSPERGANFDVSYPLVTTGGGALPLPTKQPPKLRPATTNANASAIFFIGSSADAFTAY